MTLSTKAKIATLATILTISPFIFSSSARAKIKQKDPVALFAQNLPKIDNINSSAKTSENIKFNKKLLFGLETLKFEANQLKYPASKAAAITRRYENTCKSIFDSLAADREAQVPQTAFELAHLAAEIKFQIDDRFEFGEPENKLMSNAFDKKTSDCQIDLRGRAQLICDILAQLGIKTEMVFLAETNWETSNHGKPGKATGVECQAHLMVKIIFNGEKYYINTNERIIPDTFHALQHKCSDDELFTDADITKVLQYYILSTLPSDRLNSLACRIMARNYADRNMLPKAIEFHSQALKLSPEDPSLYHEKASMLKHLKKYKEALENINKCILICPKIIDAYLTRAEIYILLKKNSQAIKDLDKFLKYSPDDEYATSLLNSILTPQERKERFIDKMNKLLKIDK